MNHLAQSTHKADIDYVVQTAEPTAPTIAEQMTSLAAAKPNFFIAMTVGTQYVQTITESAALSSGWTEDSVLESESSRRAAHVQHAV